MWGGSEVMFSFRKPAVFGLSATLIVFLTCAFAFRDNIAGFREPVALSSLLSALFSGIATVWLIVTVVQQSDELKLQREELKLQRDELALQRQETKRIADEAKSQNDLLTFQNQLNIKNMLVEQVRKLIESESSLCKDDLKKIREKIRIHTSQMVGVDVDDKFFYINHETDCIRRTFYKKITELITRPIISMTHNYYYTDFTNMTKNYRFKILRNFFQDAVRADLENWWRHQLPWAIGATNGISAKQVAFLLNLAALEESL
jgi:uncharacterized membrane protein YciS (DUF1049 family)